MVKDPTTLAQIIQSYARTSQLITGRQLHAQLICSGGIPSTFVANHLLHMYGRCGDLHNAIFLFERIPHRNLITWTSMISGYTMNGMFQAALRTFSLMRNAGVEPSEFTFSNAIRASASMGSLQCGKQMHSLSTKLGLNLELFVGSNLADLYSKCGSLADACQIFEEMPNKDEVSWTAMIDGYVKNGKFEEALLTFQKIFRDGGVTIDQYALCSTVIACGGLRVGRQGKCLHSCILKTGFQSETLVSNALTDMYSKAGDMESALCVFGNDSQCRNVISGTSLIDGYVEMDQIEQALSTFVELRRCGIEPNEFTFSSMVKACAGQAALEQGTQFHAQLIKTSMAEDSVVSSLLVDMYGKCGLVNSSIQVFEEIPCPPAVAWNCLIGVLAQHGRGREAIRVFYQTVCRRIKPSHITFVNLLMACSHSGLVEEGLGYFNSMGETYGIGPLEEHYSCVIDLLSRAGRLQEAEEFIGRMPFEPNAFGWCSLLRACRSHGDLRRAELAAENLMKLEPDNSATHVLLSDVYATAGQWEDVKAVRKLMRDVEVKKKLPGYSWVDADRKTHVFGAEDWSHPLKIEIYDKLEELSKQIREAGYIPDTSSVSSNLEASTKERILNHHSERIAVAFALISTPVTKPIIVKKNLRVCVDCHSAIKFISKVIGREIIVRDVTRFHHFANGLCSCGDFW